MIVERWTGPLAFAPSRACLPDRGCVLCSARVLMLCQLLLGVSQRSGMGALLLVLDCRRWIRDLAWRGDFGCLSANSSRPMKRSAADGHIDDQPRINTAHLSSILPRKSSKPSLPAKSSTPPLLPGGCWYLRLQ